MLKLLEFPLQTAEVGLVLLGGSPGPIREAHPLAGEARRKSLLGQVIEEQRSQRVEESPKWLVTSVEQN